MHCDQVMLAKGLAATVSASNPNTILSQWLCGTYATHPDRVLAIDEKVAEFFEAAVPQHARTLPPSASLTLSVGPSAHGEGVVISAQLGLLRQAVHARLESASEEAIASAIDRPAVILQCWLRDEWGDVSAASRVSCILALEHDLRLWLAGTYVSGFQCRHCGLFRAGNIGALLSHEKACVRAPSNVRQANAAPTLPHHVELEHTPVIVGGGSGVDSSVGSGIGFVGGGSGVSSSVCSGSGSGAGASSASGVGCSSGRACAAPGPEHAALVQRLARHKHATGLSQAALAALVGFDSSKDLGRWLDDDQSLLDVEGRYDAAVRAFLGEDGADPAHVTPALRKPIRTANRWHTRKVVDRAQGPAGADGADGALSDPPQASGAAIVVVAAAASASGRVSVQLNVRSGVALHGLDPRLDLLRAPTASGWWGISYNHKTPRYPWRVDCATDVEHSSSSREG